MSFSSCRYNPGDIDTATAYVKALVADPQLRAKVGTAGRDEVGLWDWKAATQHLLDVQYPAAMASAAAYYGKAVAKTLQQNPPPAFA